MKPLRARLRLSFGREAWLVAVLLAVVAAMAAMSPQFLTAYNLLEMSSHFVETGLIALPMTMVIISGGIDLSVGSVMGLSDVMLGFLWRHTPLGIWLAAMGAMVTGTAAGALNGLLVAGAGIPPLIATLATMAIFRGLALGISQGEPVFNYPDSFFVVGQGHVGPVPTQLVLFAVCVAVAWVWLARTAGGRAVYAIGASEGTATFSGLPVRRAKALLYAFSGFMCGVAAVVYVSRVSTAKADAGQGMELDVISAVVLGGTSVVGGEGSIAGTVLGLLIISSLRNGLTLAGAPSEVQMVIIGGLLIAAVGLDHAMRQRRASKRPVAS